NLIDRISQEDTEGYLLSCKDSYLFTVGLFSLLHEEKKVCLPPGMEEGLLKELSTDKGLISDFYPSAIHPKQNETSTKISLKKFSDGQLSLFTSGSTGERKEIRKSLSQFNEEISVLNQQWPFPETQSIISSVSHQHIYGLLFKVLWPLASKRPFLVQDCLFEDELNSTFTSFPDSILISCPAHLDAMVKFPEQDFLQNRHVFSSGAPLSSTTAKEIKSISGNSPVEVFGSTETGGIAWRKQSESTDWILFDKVQISNDENKTLSVKSPFCEIQNEWYETGDKVEILDEKTFSHLGRKDRIVKVSGKRLSLDEMESKIKNSSFVEECKIVLVSENSQTARESTAAILILTSKGSETLQKIGRRKFALIIKTELKNFYTAVLIPRFWRYVDSFPVNSQGKLESALLDLFLLGFDENENRHPELKSITKSPDECILKITVPTNCDFFEGHFPETPILPGVGQIFWAQLYSKKLFSFNKVIGIKKLKFHHIIQPGEVCELILKQNGDSIQFSFSKGEKTFSSGFISYA
ncbi:MAG: AMP-binding protein, partial [Lentisphaeraceae bacterium]|nr:AMP-binding protein [Lentisphaeraceae bacterium]